MAVAKNHIVELREIILKHVGTIQIIDLLRDLQTTPAYKLNKSFRDTINRLAISIESERRGWNTPSQN